MAKNLEESLEYKALHLSKLLLYMENELGTDGLNQLKELKGDSKIVNRQILKIINYDYHIYKLQNIQTFITLEKEKHVYFSITKDFMTKIIYNDKVYYYLMKKYNIDPNEFYTNRYLNIFNMINSQKINNNI